MMERNTIFAVRVVGASFLESLESTQKIINCN